MTLRGGGRGVDGGAGRAVLRGASRRRGRQRPGQSHRGREDLLIQRSEVSVGVRVRSRDERAVRAHTECVPARHDIGAHAADEDVEVGVFERVSCAGPAREPQRPQEHRLIVIHSVVCAEISDDAGPTAAGPGGDPRSGIGRPALPPDDEKRLPCGGDGRFQGGDVLGRGRRGRQWTRWDRLGGGLLEQCLLRQPHDDGARTAGGCGMERVGDDPCGGVRVIQDEHLLRGGAEPACRVELLEGLTAALRGGDEPHEEDERCRILVGRVDGDHRVGGARSTGDHGDARTAGEAGLRECRVARAALLAAHDSVDGGVVEPVEHVEERFARHVVDPVDPLPLQLTDDEVACGHGGRGGSGDGGGGCDFAHGPSLITRPGRGAVPVSHAGHEQDGDRASIGFSA